MRHLLLLSISVTFVHACASQKYPSTNKQIGPETVKFESTPLGANITLSDQSDASYVKSCITPCEISLEVNRKLDFKATKTGYLSNASENIFHRDAASEKLSMAMMQAMTGKTYSYGQRTIKVELLTAEEKIKRDAEKAKKLEKKRMQDEKINTALADNSLAQCDATYQMAEGESQKNAQPLVRTPPIMPAGLKKSGHCRLKMNINKSGRVSDAITTYCTDDAFRPASLKSVQKWVYNPRVINGEPASRCGVETKISFRMMDKSGKILPE